MSTVVAKNIQIGSDGTSTNNFTIFQPVTPDGTLRIGNGNSGITSSSVSLDSSGNLGLGVTPSAWRSAAKAFEGPAGSVWDLSTTVKGVGQNAFLDAVGWKYKSTAAASNYEQSAGSHAWYNAPSGTAGNAISFTQAMTLDASGNLLVGTTSAVGKVTVFHSGVFGQDIRYTGGTGTAFPLIFEYGTSTVGSISTSSTATAYNTSSDYRLKEDIQPMTGALAKVAALKPCTYKWKADGSDGEGFIAHELAEVVPACVTGEKDAVDADGKPVYQGIDTSFLVATLTAAIQELKAEFDAYKASHP